MFIVDDDHSYVLEGLNATYVKFHSFINYQMYVQIYYIYKITIKINFAEKSI